MAGPMGLILPTVGAAPGPFWASTLNTALGVVENHDHSFGKGSYITPLGLDLNADVTFTGRSPATANNAIGLRSVRFVDQSSVLSNQADKGSLYFSGGNLYANNSVSNVPVQITSGASLSAAGTGSISGLSAPATASYGGGTFTWQSNTNAAAAMDMGPTTIRDTAASAKAITLQSPIGLANAYSVTLPTALPAGTSFLQISASGALTTLAQLTGSNLTASAGILGSQLAAAAGITRGQLASVGQQVSSSCGSFTSSSASYTDITNLTVTITTAGRPVMLIIQSDGSGAGTGGFFPAGIGSTNIRILRGATQLSVTNMGNQGTSGNIEIPNVIYLDAVGAGTYTYKAQAQADGTHLLAVNNMVLMAYEL